MVVGLEVVLADGSIIHTGGLPLGRSARPQSRLYRFRGDAWHHHVSRAANPPGE